MFTDRHGVRAAFQAVGEFLSADGETLSIVVVGGAGLNLTGIIERVTSDVDVIARVERGPDGALRMSMPIHFRPHSSARSVPLRAI
jgi:Nucleotidyltransferase of unknown function (DUF6036)